MANINWNYPEPREGMAGSYDRLIGPGATRAEIYLQFTFAAAAGVAMPTYAILNHLGWSTIQLFVATAFAVELTGGICTNATSSAKRWYHQPGMEFRQHFTFVAIHIHPLIIAWLFRSMDWMFFVVVYGYLLAATAIILRTELYLRRPVAFILFSGGILINGYLFTPTHGLEWFVPFFYLKLLMGHILREEPYRPEGEKICPHMPTGEHS